MEHKHISKFLSLILRHKPETIGIELDNEGWVSVDELLEKLKLHGKPVSLEQLQEVVATNNKKRFRFSDDGKRIRANQGHSVAIDLALAPTTPPPVLYHGTATKNLDSIFEKGLIKGSRQHVHLSKELGTAINVGARHGKPVVLEVDAAQMHQLGFHFFLSENGVWLTDHIPPKFLKQQEEK